MPRGKKTPPEVIYRIMTSWAVTNNCKETARDLELPVATVMRIVNANKDKPEFIKLRSEKLNEFSVRASEIIQKGLTLLDKRFGRAIESEEELDILIDEIFAADKAELSQDEKKRLVNKLKALQLEDIKAVTASICTLYEKKALADGDVTDNVSVEIKLPQGADEYAG